MNADRDPRSDALLVRIGSFTSRLLKSPVLCVAESRSDPESSQNSEAEDTLSEKETKKSGTALKTVKKSSKKNRR